MVGLIIMSLAGFSLSYMILPIFGFGPNFLINQETFSNNYIWSKDSNNWLYWDNSDISKLRYFNYDNEEWNDWQR